MTSVPLALPVLVLFLLQTPDQGKQPREQAPPVDLSPAAPQATPPTVSGEKPFGKLFEPAEERAARQALADQNPRRFRLCPARRLGAGPGPGNSPGRGRIHARVRTQSKRQVDHLLAFCAAIGSPSDACR